MGQQKRTREVFAQGVSIVSVSDGDQTTMLDSIHLAEQACQHQWLQRMQAVQQMVQEGWLTGHNETLTEHDLGSCTMV